MAVSIFLLSGLASVTGSRLGLSSTGSGLPSSSITAAVGANDADELILAEGSLARGVGPAAGQLWSCAQPSTGGSAHCTASLVSTAAKVPTWSSLTSPDARYGAGLVYDAKDGFVVLFGGGTGTTVLGDTWEFTHGSWIQLFPYDVTFRPCVCLHGLRCQGQVCDPLRWRNDLPVHCPRRYLGVSRG